MSGHAKLSPSSSSRWLNCPGSVAASVGIANESSVYADEGTFAHSVAEQAIKSTIANEITVGEALVGFMGLESDCDRFTVDGEMLDHLEEYVDFCVACDEVGAKSWVEARVHATPEVYGTADFMAVVGTALEVADLKYGAGTPVSPVGNTQAAIYALGALRRLESSDTKLFEKVKTVNIRIFQPRNRAGGGCEVVTVAELLRWRDKALLPGIKATEDDDALRVAGDHCKFCPVAGTCYAKKDAALEGAAAVFADTETLTVEETPPDPKDLTLEEVGKVLKAAPLIESWLKGVRAYAYDRANAGKTIEGFKLVRKVGNRKWKDEELVEVMLREMLPEGEAIHAKPKMLSPAQAEKKLDIIGKALVFEHTTKPDAGLSLVPETDKRPAFSPGDVFDSQEEKDLLT
jgi:hypothetical protein